MDEYVAVVIQHGDRVVMVRDNDVIADGRLKLPGGKREKGERFSETVTRELAEELPKAPIKVAFIGDVLAKKNGGEARFFLFEGKVNTLNIDLTPGAEVIEALLLSFEDAIAGATQSSASLLRTYIDVKGVDI